MEERKAYLSDVKDEEWAFVAPYLTLIDERRCPVTRLPFARSVQWNALIGTSQGFLADDPHDLLPWWVGYQQTQRWLKAGVFETMVHDLRVLLRLAQGRNKQPTTVISDSRTLQSTPESGGRAGYDSAKRERVPRLTWR